MSGLGNLSQCIVYGDPAEVGRARWLRGRAMAVSTTIEVAIVASLLLWPLMTTAVLPQQHMAAPVPVFHPAPPPNPPLVREQERPAPRAVFGVAVLRQPLVIPTHTYDGPIEAPSPPDISTTSLSNGIVGVGTEAANVAPPGAKAHANAPIHVSSGVMAARLIHSVQPEYPAVAKAIHLEGAVQLRAIIGIDGTVQNIEIASGNPILARAAVAAVREWRYQPTLLSGKPVEVETVITVQFQMAQ